MSLLDDLAREISVASGRRFVPASRRSAAGGCINESFVLEGQDGSSHFVKLNRPELADMFAAEAEGLAELANARAIRVPQPLFHGLVGDRACLVMEHVLLGGPRRSSMLGEQLAQLHLHVQPRFGWHRNNTIGSTPQHNAYDDDWASFWSQRRIAPQLDLSRRRGAPGSLIDAVEALIPVVPAFFSDYHPRASLLHGDLWGGNQDADRQGRPVIFDPAVYFGDREADVAMTELFGGFDRDFYAAYDAVWPRDPGYAVRRDLYNLYHVLNHFNLFGGGYAHQSERMARSLLSEVREL